MANYGSWYRVKIIVVAKKHDGNPWQFEQVDVVCGKRTLFQKLPS